MYAEPRMFLPYMQNFSQDFQQLEEYCKFNKPNSSMSNILLTSNISDYDLGGEGDLFKAPELVIEEPLGSLDQVTSTISMISCGEDVTSQDLKVANLESIHNEQLLSEVFNDWDKDLIEKAATDAFSEVMDITLPVMLTDENQNQENKMLPEVPFQKSVSSGCLTSTHSVHGIAMNPSFLDLTGVDFGTVYGMRRAFSEGDIKTLDNGNMSIIHSHLNQPLMIGGCLAEDRKEKLSRYRNKKTKRNFGRRIKYACRKALADSQPRIRGRFAKTDESDVSKKQ